MVGECGPAYHEGEKNAAGYGLKKNVEAAVEDRSDSAGVEGEVRDREP